MATERVKLFGIKSLVNALNAGKEIKARYGRFHVTEKALKFYSTMCQAEGIGIRRNVKSRQGIHGPVRIGPRF